MNISIMWFAFSAFAAEDAAELYARVFGRKPHARGNGGAEAAESAGAAPRDHRAAEHTAVIIEIVALADKIEHVLMDTDADPAPPGAADDAARAARSIKAAAYELHARCRAGGRSGATARLSSGGGVSSAFIRP